MSIVPLNLGADELVRLYPHFEQLDAVSVLCTAIGTEHVQSSRRHQRDTPPSDVPLAIDVLA